MAEMLNAVRIAVGRRWATRTSTAMIRDGKHVRANGPAKERLGFYVNNDPDLPDLNRLFTECAWDADTGRGERKLATSHE